MKKVIGKIIFGVGFIISVVFMFGQPLVMDWKVEE